MPMSNTQLCARPWPRWSTSEWGYGDNVGLGAWKQPSPTPNRGCLWGWGLWWLLVLHIGATQGQGHTRTHTSFHFPRWNTTVQTLVASYEAYEDLMKKSQEGKDFYTDLEGKAAKLLEKARAACQAAEANRQQILEK